MQGLQCVDGALSSLNVTGCTALTDLAVNGRKASCKITVRTFNKHKASVKVRVKQHTDQRI